jgi:hypothetical protein
MQGLRRNIEVRMMGGLQEEAHPKYSVQMEVEVLAPEDIDSEAILEEWIANELSGKLIRVRNVQAKER